MLSGEPITMQDILSETAITYPEAYVQSMTGDQLKAVMEDVCDNLFNLDPYHQQGGDMVRRRRAELRLRAHRRCRSTLISDLKLASGRALEATKSYKVSGWASVNEQKGEPVWDVFAKHLRRPDKSYTAAGCGSGVHRAERRADLGRGHAASRDQGMPPQQVGAGRRAEGRSRQPRALQDGMTGFDLHARRGDRRC